MNRRVLISNAGAILLVALFLAAPAPSVPFALAGEDNNREEQKINELLDAWHRAAATADEDTFFGSMTEDAVYLGTDAGERWTRTQFETWAKKHFERESAWSFRPYNRTVYVTGDGEVAWFEELLETWMGVCRGSGVLVRDPAGTGGWKIAHYNLAVTVPNELIDDFIAIFDKSPPDKKPPENDSQQ